jgi:hypothetical protein
LANQRDYLIQGRFEIVFRQTPTIGALGMTALLGTALIVVSSISVAVRRKQPDGSLV